ncbi:cell division protein FtsQ/DivIB [Moheibacter sediminis]|uniref:Cell division protein FtsQ n=1 Tax=Moheibacter sediminis TaxID=1434700 RepID=A0A1W2CSB5_9FLAO|nr:cell division protein FtsQ [Moheibacter sediminis]SMC87782.1 cell division protein FtsQ [Moheibacter sediminis]
MKAKLTILKAFLGVAILAFLVSFSAQRHACKELKDIKIKIDHESGTYFVNDSLVRILIDGNKLKVSQIPLGNLNISEVEQTLNKSSFIKKSEVFQNIDGEMSVEITQETPVARVNTGEDEYYLTKELTKIPLSNLYSAEVMLVGGKIEEEDFKGLNELLKFVMADKLLKKHIIAVKKQQPNSFILLVNKGDYIIEFGELKDFEKKFEKLKLFYNQYLGKVGMNYYKTINLKFNNQIVATKRNSDE